MLLVLTGYLRAFGQVSVSLLVALSILLVTLTFTSISAASSGGMSCCPNGQSNHCNSGIVAKPAAKPEAEPACHHESVTETDPDTIVAEPNSENAESRSSYDSKDHIALASMRASCASDCCSLGLSTSKRPNRQSIELVRRTIDNKPLVDASDCGASLVLLYPRSFSKPIPRGPPSGTTF